MELVSCSNFSLTNLFNNVRPFATYFASQWWTGEDSNLRSPQGAADLQSAGFSHSPTRPAKAFGQRWRVRPNAQTHPGQRKRVPQTQPDLNRTAVRGASQCRKGSCQETPALALLSRGIRPHPCPKILILA